MVKCIIVGCTSGYKSNPEKVHYFSAPKDKELRAKWQKCIPRKNFILSDTSYVCEKHFKEFEIIKFWESGSVKVPYKRWKLKEGTIPSLFPGPAYLSNLKKPRKLPAIRTSCNLPNSKDKENINVLNFECPTIVNPAIQDHLFHKLINIQLCSPWIKLPMSQENNELCFVIFNLNSKPIPVIEKCIKINDQDEVTFAVHGKIIEIKEHKIQIGNSIEQFISNLKEFEDLKLCNGGPIASMFPNFSKALCSISDKGLLQHHNCLHVVEKCSKSNCCNNCKSLKNILMCREKRKVNGSKAMIEVSPTKKIKITEMRKKSYSLQRTVVRTKKKVTVLKEELNKSHKEMADCNEQFIQDKLSDMNESQKSLILECFAASRVKNSKSRRYSENWLMLCLLFNIRSPSAYKYLRASALLPLPHPKTVRKHLSSVKTCCGFDKDFLRLLQKKTEEMLERNKHGVLLFDAVNLRKSLAVNSTNLTYLGLEDYGNEIIDPNYHKEYADHALVFMWQSLGSNFCQTIGCFASKGEVKGVMIAQLVLKAISLLENIGIYVDGIICDGATTNRRMWTEFGVDGTKNNLKNYFEHPTDPDRKVYVFSDFVHLFKCVRNRLYNNKHLRLNSDSKQIAWDYFKEVYKEDIKHPGNLRIVPRITPQHLNLTPMAKMRVRLCVQVFSMSMANALRYYESKGNIMLKHCSETANFIEFWNNLFDNFNRNLPWQGLKLCDKEGFQGFSDALSYIDCWEDQMVTGNISPEEFLTKQTAQGLRVTINSTIELSKYLLDSCGYDYVLIGKMCQDPLEKFFGIIRQSCGPNDHPTTPTFLHLYKILSVYSVLKPPKHGNCTVSHTDLPKVSLSDLKEIFHDQSSDRSEKINRLKLKLDQLIEDGLWEPCEVLPQLNTNIENNIRDCILYYVCGYVTRQILKKQKCNDCISYFKSGDANHPCAELVNLKTNGKLMYPNPALFEFLNTVENSFSKHCNDFNVFEKVINDITQENFNFKFSCTFHKVEVASEVIIYFLQMRMRQHTYQENIKFQKITREKKKISKLYNT